MIIKNKAFEDTVESIRIGNYLMKMHQCSFEQKIINYVDKAKFSLNIVRKFEFVAITLCKK